MDLLTHAKTLLNPETLSKLTNHLDIEASALPSLIDQALPALFAIFLKATQDPSKSEQVTQFLSEVDSSILSEPNAILDARGSDLMRSGKAGLAKLLGPQLTDYISPIAKSTGLGEGKIASSLGTLAPFVLAIFSQKSKNATDLEALLAKENITVAPDTKTQPKEDSPQKSYLPDPSKKSDKRPFPKRKAILLALILAAVTALIFWLIDSGKDSPPSPPTGGQKDIPAATLPIPEKSATTPPAPTP